MKIVKATNIGIAAAIVTFSTSCTQKREKELSAELASTQSALSKTQAELANARKARKEAEDQLSKANAQAEIPSQTDEKADAGKTPGKPSSKKDRFSYAVGLQIGGDFEDKGVEIDFDQFAEGIRTAYLSHDRLMDEKESKEILDEVWKEYQQRERAKRSAASEITKKESTEYLAANLKKPGVKATPSGLQYRVIKAGEGKSPTKADKVEVHYRGWTIDGNEFDSSHSRNKPSTFGVTQVIRGWTEALSMMKPGSKWEIVVPQELAYGPGGKRPKIPPYSTLRFEVELLSVIKSTPPVAKKPVTSNIVRIPSQTELNQGAKPEILTKEREAELKKKNQ
ncbi:MAG: FKBP-type peptidyl-prolyl cis-trans isomerase [Verrucomicrobiota bacterium]|jgi:FKBP-type peptidyl-prolyl cis-trans isomerase|nr:FKBP-type peptidyl-prolyl cis-trans isomerase [Verrucomicrobiota bacterium]